MVRDLLRREVPAHAEGKSAHVGYLLAVLIGIALGLLGGGGSILTVPLLAYVFGLDAKHAIATSLPVVAAASAAACLAHARAGRVRWRTGLAFAGTGMLGAHVGGRVGSLLPGAVLLALFGSLMVATSVAMWRGRSEAEPLRRSAVALAGIGGIVGFVTGLLGAGGGFAIVPALVLWAGLEMPSAVGTSLLVIALNALAGFSGYATHVQIDLALAGGVAGCMVTGSFVGALFGQRLPAGDLRRGFAAFVLAMGSFVVLRESAGVFDVRSALPATLPQALFAGLLFGIGAFIGRATPRERPRPLESFDEGSGI